VRLARSRWMRSISLRVRWWPICIFSNPVRPTLEDFGPKFACGLRMDFLGKFVFEGDLWAPIMAKRRRPAIRRARKGPAEICIEKTRTSLSSSHFVGQALRQSKSHGDCDAHDREDEDNRRQPNNFTQLISHSDPHMCLKRTR